MDETTTSIIGKRRPRSSFDRVLRKMLAKLVPSHIYEVSWTGAYNWLPKKASKFSIDNVWAVGSFARGAISCGDLDLVLELSIVDGNAHPPEKRVLRELGSFTGISIFIGTPDENSSGVSFPEAIHLWSPSEPNWESALGSILVDPNSGRFPRDHDMLPLRREQICRGDLEQIEIILDELEKQVLTSEWVPIETMAAQRPANLGAETKRYLDCITLFTGVKTARVMQLAVPWLNISGAPLLKDLCNCTPTSVKVGKTKFITGLSPNVPLHSLDGVECDSLAVMPHITRRGPNGIWILRRGPNHPFHHTQE